MEKILIHTCCAVCFAYSSKLLRELGYEVISYFYNPNIYPEKEYLRRQDELIKFCNKYNYELIIDDYSPKDFLKIVKGLEFEPEKGIRCEKCFGLRLNKTAKKAEELGIKEFTTTLTISPHKSSKMIEKVGYLSQTDKTKFTFFDFKKKDGFKKTNEIARQEGMYRQEYCGCMFSIRH